MIAKTSHLRLHVDIEDKPSSYSIICEQSIQGENLPSHRHPRIVCQNSMSATLRTGYKTQRD